MWSCVNDKALWPDGWFTLVKIYQDILKNAIVDFVDEFRSTSEISFRRNSYFITLIHKVDDPRLTKYLIHISLIGLQCNRLTLN